MARRALLIVAVLATQLAIVAPAFAHLTFVSMTPSGPEELETPPAQVVLTFDKAIGDGLTEVTLTGPDGSTDPLEPRVEGASATMQLPAKLEGGLWRVEWAATGADGHPQRDSRTFTIAGGSTTTTAAAFPAGNWRVVGYAGRAAFFAGLLGLVGSIAFAVTAARGFQPWGLRGMVLSTVLGATVVLASHAALLDRLGAWSAFAPWNVGPEAVAQAGRGYALAAVLAVAAWIVSRTALRPEAWRARGGRPPWPLIALAGVAAAAPTLSSHAMASSIAWLRVPLDMVHLAAASIWLGGLVQLLALTIPRRRANPGIPAAIDVFSFLAFCSIATLVVTGAFAALVELDASIGQLFGTTYGRLVLAKVGLLVLAAPLALANRRHHVPGIIAGGTESLPTLRRYVRWELFVAAWIVLATAALVHAAPGEDHSQHGGSHAGHQI